MYTACSALGLRPLDRVQIHNLALRRELGSTRMQREVAPPFWFFQRDLCLGRLLVRSPAGFAEELGIDDISDIRRRLDGPVEVMALPDLVQRSLQSRRPMVSPSPGDFARAHVLWVEKSRWGIEAHVRFVDESLNDHRQDRIQVQLAKSSRETLEAIASRDVMPVATVPSRCSLSAERGEGVRVRQASALAGRFIRAALAGDHRLATTLATEDGLRPRSGMV